MIENGRLGHAKVKKRALTQERKLFSEICQSKTLEFSEDLAGKFNSLHARRTLALDRQQTDRQTN